MTEKPTWSAVQSQRHVCLTKTVALKLTLLPVQNMGQCSQGTSRALPNQVLRYGLRTISGRTGGVKVEAPTVTATARSENSCMAKRSFRDRLQRQSNTARHGNHEEED